MSRKKKPIRKQDSNFLYGIAPVFEALKYNKRSLHRLFYKEGKPSPRIKEILQLAQKAGLSEEAISNDELYKLTGNHQNQGIALQCGTLPTSNIEEIFYGKQEKHCFIALDQIEDPQNVGAIIRTATFLGASGLIQLHRNSAPLSSTVSKASAGTMEFFPIYQVNNLADTLQLFKKHQYWVIGSSLSENSENFRTITVPEKIVLVVGNEGSGLRRLTEERCDLLAHIPGNATDSLNVSVATGILLNHFLHIQQSQ